VHARTLTQMEQRVALLVAAGRTNAEVAAELGLSAKTVEWHISRAFRKLNVRSRDDLAALLASNAGERLGEAVE
jgi:DNA-binding CsgD family transcriptional regulator